MTINTVNIQHTNITSSKKLCNTMLCVVVITSAARYCKHHTVGGQLDQDALHLSSIYSLILWCIFLV